jgi:hypothetical protein
MIEGSDQPVCVDHHEQHSITVAQRADILNCLVFCFVLLLPMLTQVAADSMNSCHSVNPVGMDDWQRESQTACRKPLAECALLHFRSSKWPNKENRHPEKCL